ncbi:MAG: nucleotidyltransferase family protein, partial [Anaerolineales bacterium]
GIILAAGGAARYGRPKQLLDYHGRPFVRATAQTALRAGLEPVIVVSGAAAEEVAAAVAGLPVQVVHNPHWPSGQASSIRTGLGALPPNTGAALFLLADQPQVTVEVIRALIERHAQTMDAVLAPYVFDQRANPVLFDRITFEALSQLSGDVGGRGIFSRFSPRYVNWYDRLLLLDVDTPEDYAKLMSPDD